MKDTDIMTFMNNNDRTGFVRTTVYIPRHLHESAKIMAVLTRSKLSTIMREALSDKLKKLRETPMREDHDHCVGGTDMKGTK